jgi:hypothetical protein
MAWGIFEHAEAGKPTGRGFVVRECEPRSPSEPGLFAFRALDSFNYGDQRPRAADKTRARAEQLAYEWPFGEKVSR